MHKPIRPHIGLCFEGDAALMKSTGWVRAACSLEPHDSFATTDARGHVLSFSMRQMAAVMTSIRRAHQYRRYHFISHGSLAVSAQRMTATPHAHAADEPLSIEQRTPPLEPEDTQNAREH
jgi:hypothetical protein